MKKTEENIESVVVMHSANGFIDFVEIDGEKFVPDPDDESKAKNGEDGKPVKYVDPDTSGKDDDDDDKKSKKESDKVTLEKLAETDPEAKKTLDRLAELEKAETDRVAKEAEDEEKRKKEAGEFDDIIKGKDGDLKTLKEDVEKKSDIIGKYQGTIKTVLEEKMKQIPEENQSLIPEEFSDRQKLEYISKNEERLGVKMEKGGKGGVPKGGGGSGTPLEQKRAEWDELRKKENKTPSEHTKVWDLSKEIKALEEEDRNKT